MAKQTPQTLVTIVKSLILKYYFLVCRKVSTFIAEYINGFKMEKCNFNIYETVLVKCNSRIVTIPPFLIIIFFFS